MKNNNSLGSSIKSALSVTTLSALLATSSLITSSSAAAFILNFNPGVVTTDSTYGTTTVNSGSYFGLDTNAGGVSPFERTAISQHDGLIVDATTIQQASGSHSFAPDGSESPGIDNAWNYFGNTGMHLTTSPVSVLNADVNNDGGFT